MKIIRVTEDAIEFNNGSSIEYGHEQDCCEQVYADFKAIEDLALDVEFDENLIFENVKDSGFRFGNPNRMFYIPCYNIQNGYYSDNIDIYYNNKLVLQFDVEENGFWFDPPKH